MTTSNEPVVSPAKSPLSAPEQAGVRNSAPKSHIILLVLILTLGVFLRFFGLTHHSIWLDEAISIHVAKMDFGGIINWLKIDAHPPLFYFLLHAWMKVFGGGELAVRAFPALIGALSLFAFYWVGASLFGRRAGLFALLIAAVGEFHVYYSQEVRMYTLLPLLGLLALFWLYKAAAQDRTRDWAGYGLLLTATLYTHNYGAFFAAAGIVYFVITSFKRKVSWAKFLIVQGAVCFVYLPWFYFVGLRQLMRTDLLGHVPPIRPAFVWQTFLSYTGLSFHIFRPDHSAVFVAAASAVFLACFLFGILPLALKMNGRTQVSAPENRAGLTLILGYLTVVLGLPMIISIWKPIFLPYRYSIAAWPAFVLILGLGLARLTKPSLRAAALIAIMAVSATSLYSYRFLSVKSYDREIAAFIDAQAGAKDVIFFAPDTRDFAIKYYLRSRPKIVGYPTEGGVAKRIVARAAAGLKRRSAKIFLIYESSWDWVPHLEDVQRLFDERLRRIEQKRYGSTILTIYVPKRIAASK